MSGTIKWVIGSMSHIFKFERVRGPVAREMTNVCGEYRTRQIFGEGELSWGVRGQRGTYDDRAAMRKRG